MGQQDLRVHELVTKIERGDIRLPEMQRQYVWRQTRVRDLLDSLYRGYPSGTILTWETDEEVATRDFAVEQDASMRRGFQLLLDGQQRLTSLSAILLGKPIHVRDRKRPIDILFNLEHPENLKEVTEVFENEKTEDDPDSDPDESTADASEDEILERFNRMAFVVYSNKLANLPNWVSVSEVFKEGSDAPFLKKAGVTSMDDPLYGKYTARLRRLRDIKDYSYRVHILDQDKSYEEITEIFVRVNSLGSKLRSSDLALAQITAKWRDSLKIFENFRSECRDDHEFDLDLSIHLKNLVAFATGQSRFRTVGSLSEEHLKSNWEDAKKGMRFALNFLKSNVGIDSPALLSSHFIIITLAAYGYSKNYNLTPEESAELRYWVLSANSKARYSRGATETFLDQDLSALGRGLGTGGLLQLLKTQVGALNILPGDLKNRNSRSAYFKAMFMAFKADSAQDWGDQLVISLRHVGAQHRLQFHHIFPKAVLSKFGANNQEINDICNLIFISGGENRRIGDKEPAVYLPDVVKKVGVEELHKQCIPDDPSLWSVNSYGDFLDERRNLVSDKLNKFLGHDKFEMIS